MTSHEPEEPTFASPTPPGSLPAPDLDAVRLPAADGGPPEVWLGTVVAPDARSAAVRQRTRRRVWIVGAAVVVLAVALAAVVLGVRAARERAWEPLPTELSEPRDAQAVQLVLGSCIEDVPDGGGEVTQVRAVPCEEPHEAQVVGRTDAGPDAVWPGGESLADRGSRSCGADLLGPETRQDGAKDLRFVVWAPSEDSWSAGDRTTLCLAVADRPRSGSLLR